jgi:hypothetical protein
MADKLNNALSTTNRIAALGKDWIARRKKER